MTEIIHHLDLEESIQVLHKLSTYAFTPTPPLPELEPFAKVIRQQKGAEYFAVFADGGPQSIGGLRDLSQNLRGNIFRMGGIANVASHPAGRRKGYVRTLLRHIFKVCREEGFVISCLYPFKEAFYERFGYVTLPQAMKILFNPEVLAPVLNMDHEGSVELVKFEQGYAEYLAYLEEIQQTTHGLSRFALPNPEMAKERDTWLAFARSKDRLVGLMQYTLKGEMMQQELYAHDFLYSNPQGKFLLLDWIARHINQVVKAVLVLQPNIKGETLFTDLRPKYKGLFLPPMGRVINIENLRGLKVGKGEINIQVTDTDCEWNNGVWMLASENGHLTIKKGRTPDCDLTIQGLSALIYGVYDPDEFNLRGWGNPEGGSSSVLRGMFPAATPFLHAMY